MDIDVGFGVAFEGITGVDIGVGVAFEGITGVDIVVGVDEVSRVSFWSTKNPYEVPIEFVVNLTFRVSPTNHSVQKSSLRYGL